MRCMERARTTLVTVVALVSLLSACSGTSTDVAPITLADTPATTAPRSETTAPNAGETSTTDTRVDTTVGGMPDDVLDMGDDIALADAATIIVLDGWSAASLAEDGIDWQYGGTTSTITWRVADRADLAAIAARDTTAVTALAARLVTADPSLTCDTDECRTSSRVISFDELVDPQSSHLLGQQYREWGITGGVLVAASDATAGSLRYGSTTYSISPLDSTEASETGLATSTGVHAIGVAFGHLFPLDPRWLDTDKPFYGVLPGSDTMSQETVDIDALFRGLGTYIPAARALSSSQLTWRSSPTTGCGVGVLCVPGVVTATVDVLDTQSTSVCSDAGDGRVDLYAVDVTYTYPAATHQFGLWPSAPDGVIGGRTLVWTDNIPLTTGGATFHVSIALLFDTRGLLQFNGLVADHAQSTPSERTHQYRTSDVPALFSDTLRTC